MKRFVLLILAVLFIGSFLGGCNGVAHSFRERKDRFRTIDDLRVRGVVDDCDYVAMYDRPSYLTEWPIRDTD